MPLKIADAPEKSYQQLAQWLPQILTSPVAVPSVRSAGMAAIGGASKPVEYEVGMPHNVYVMSVSALAEGKGLTEARLSSWRHMIFHGDDAVAAAEVIVRQDDSYTFSHLSSGPAVASTLSALHRFDGTPDLQGKEFEIRLLRLPEIGVELLWAHTHELDLLTPLPPVNYALIENRIYDEKQLLAALADQARRYTARAGSVGF